MEPLVFGLFGASFVANIILAVRLKQALRRPPPTPTFGAEELLHDLTRGPALVRVERVDASNLLIRSPKG